MAAKTFSIFIAIMPTQVSLYMGISHEIEVATIVIDFNQV